MAKFKSVPTPAVSNSHTLELARKVLEIEADAVRDLASKLDEHFQRAVDLILGCTQSHDPSQGRVVVSGIGKSGHIARKIASTLASTGTPAFFVHPAEASHGDLGMITRHDVFIGLSNSGESAELLAIVPIIKRQGAKLIAMTGNPASTLAIEADIHLYAGAAQEACPLGLAPTASTTAALALGDALAVALLDARGFGPEDFARSHPGGTLGRRLLTHVRDVMRTGERVPQVPDSATLTEAVMEISKKGLGMTAIVDQGGRVRGIYTDGDLRRTLEKNVDFRTARVLDYMTASPQTISPGRLAVEAVTLMEEHRINQLLVVDEQGKLTGALNMHDLFQAKIL